MIQTCVCVCFLCKEWVSGAECLLLKGYVWWGNNQTTSQKSLLWGGYIFSASKKALLQYLSVGLWPQETAGPRPVRETAWLRILDLQHALIVSLFSSILCKRKRKTLKKIIRKKNYWTEERRHVETRAWNEMRGHGSGMRLRERKQEEETDKLLNAALKHTHAHCTLTYLVALSSRVGCWLTETTDLPRR